MRKFLPLLLPLIFISGCNGPELKSLDVAKRTVITGTIRNRQASTDPPKEITVVIPDFNNTTYKEKINEDGSFKLYIDQYITRDIQISPTIGTIMTHPGDSIYIDADYNAGNVVFEGDAKKVNTDLQFYLTSTYSGTEDPQSKLFKLDADNYKTLCDNMRIDLLQKRGSFISLTNPSKEVIMWIDDYIKLKYYSARFDYPLSRNSKDVLNDLISYTQYLEDIETMFNSSVVNSGCYTFMNRYMGFLYPKSYLLWYKSVKATIRTDTLFVKSAEKKLSEGLSNSKNETFKQFFWSEWLYAMLQQNDIKQFNNSRNILSNIKEAFLRKSIEEYYTYIDGRIKNPRIASEALMKRMDQTEAKAILDKIIQENSGKVIYIDFWATWCIPCRRNMPYTEKLIRKYKKQDIAFVSVCILSPEDTWKLVLSDMKLTGIQYYCTNEQSKSIWNKLPIRGVPYYMLINKKGEVTETGNDLLPQKELTIEKIDRLLKKV